MRYWPYVVQIAILIFYEVSQTLAQSGEWTKWSEWSACSVTCGYGVLKRRREWKPTDYVVNDKNRIVYEDIAECSTTVYTPCPVNGSWSFWGPWSDCTAMCDTGETTRTRECASPKPTNGGKECDGKSTVHADCNEWVCPPLPPNFDISACNDTTFMCLSRRQCIPEKNVCDDTLQCHDGSDEHQCFNFIYGNGAEPVYNSLWAMVVSVIMAAINL